jgi:hypothetical protein
VGGGPHRVLCGAGILAKPWRSPRLRGQRLGDTLLVDSVDYCVEQPHAYLGYFSTKLLIPVLRAWSQHVGFSCCGFCLSVALFKMWPEWLVGLGPTELGRSP